MEQTKKFENETKKSIVFCSKSQKEKNVVYINFSVDGILLTVNSDQTIL